ncbi:hypothetical protein ACS0PU_006796 [Formica fusca]
MVWGGKWRWIAWGGRCVRSCADKADAVASSVAVPNRRGSSDLIAIFAFVLFSTFAPIASINPPVHVTVAGGFVTRTTRGGGSKCKRDYILVNGEEKHFSL